MAEMFVLSKVSLRNLIVIFFIHFRAILLFKIVLYLNSFN